MTTEKKLMSECDGILGMLHDLTSSAIRSRFASVIVSGIDFERAARVALSRLTWPWDSNEWNDVVDRLAIEIYSDDGDHWLTDEARLHRESGLDC